MGSGLRRILPIGIAIAVVLSLGATSVLAQDPVTPAAGVNADKVDGRSAIKYSTNPTERKGKLVAFGGSGYLPNNAILKAVDSELLDGQDSTAFATFAALKNPAGVVNEADNLVSWNQLLNVPLTLADGVDDGLTKITFIREYQDFTTAPGSYAAYDKSCPSGKAVSGGFWTNSYADIKFLGSLPLSDTQWRVWALNTSAAPRTISVWVECIATTPATVIAKLSPSAKQAIKNSAKGGGAKKRR